MTSAWVGRGTRWMRAPLHAGQRVGSRGGDPEPSPMFGSVGDAEAVRKLRYGVLFAVFKSGITGSESRLQNHSRP
jgi:hypothetical protein